MIIGISPNYTKQKISEFLVLLIAELNKRNLEFVFGESILRIDDDKVKEWKKKNKVYKDEELASNCDMIISVGGDGTFLQTAFNTRKTSTPILGVNFGKLGFLAEFETSKINEMISYLTKNELIVEERNALTGKCLSENHDEFYAINDIVVERGEYPKMIKISIDIDDKYVATFSADGIIIATPTGSTGYSLSTGGPIVDPQTDTIILSPVSAHTLSMRPLVISGNQKVKIKIVSQHKNVQIICDGQRVSYLSSPAIIEIYKSENNLRLIHNPEKQYFEILRKKLYWGLDLREQNREEKL